MSIVTILNIVITIFLTNSLIAADGGVVSLPSIARMTEGVGEVKPRERVILPRLGGRISESEDAVTERRVPRASERARAVKFASSCDELSGIERKDLAGLLARTAERYYKKGKHTRACTLYFQAGQEIAKKIKRRGGACVYADRAAQYYCTAGRIAFYIDGVEDDVIVDLFSRASYYAGIASQDDPHRITVKSVAYPIRKTMTQARDSGLIHLADALEGLLTPETSTYALMLSSMRDLLTAVPAAA